MMNDERNVKVRLLFRIHRLAQTKKAPEVRGFFLLMMPADA